MDAKDRLLMDADFGVIRGIILCILRFGVDQVVGGWMQSRFAQNFITSMRLLT